LIHSTGLWRPAATLQRRAIENRKQIVMVVAGAAGTTPGRLLEVGCYFNPTCAENTPFEPMLALRRLSP
jgi:hypothetical protein